MPVKVDKLSNFLINLSEKPSTMKVFRANPVDTMTKAGLTKDEQNLVLTKDALKLKSAIYKNRGIIFKGGGLVNSDGGETVVVVVVIVIIL